MTPRGLAFALRRIAEWRTPAELARLWGDLADAVRAHPEVRGAHALRAAELGAGRR